ncbi:hypothetical protein [Sporosarcina sp. FSL W7-1283]
MDNKPIAKAIVGSVGALSVFGACAITGSISGLWGLFLVMWMMDII